MCADSLDMLCMLCGAEWCGVVWCGVGCDVLSVDDVIHNDFILNHSFFISIVILFVHHVMCCLLCPYCSFCQRYHDEHATVPVEKFDAMKMLKRVTLFACSHE